MRNQRIHYVDKKQFTLLGKLREYSQYPKQNEILKSLQDTCLYRNLTSKQKELANKLYIQIRENMIKGESSKLLQGIYNLDGGHIEMFLMTYIETSLLPEKVIKSIIKNTIYDCEDNEIKARISYFYVTKFH